VADSPPADLPFVSVILPTHNEGDFLRMTVESIERDTAHPAYEIVVVDDASTDGSCEAVSNHPAVRVIRAPGLGVAGARNAGAQTAAGDVLVFLDAHCLVSPNWLTRIVAAVQQPEIGVVGPCFTRLNESEPRAAGMTWVDEALQTAWGHPLHPCTPYPVPFVPGGCQGFRADLFREIGGYESGFKRWGYEDIEICLRLWLLGYEVFVVPDVVIGHRFRTEAAYDVPQRDLAFNCLRMVHLHFAAPRIRRVIDAIKGTADPDPLLAELHQTDVLERRRALASRRVRSDEWFFETFMPHLA